MPSNSDGSFTRGSTNRRLLGWNNPGSPNFAIVQNSFDAGVDEIHRTVFHELGHNWDEPGENSFASEFRNVAGWRDFSGRTVPSGYEKGDDNSDAWKNWYFVDRDASIDGFARDYGKMNPLEDFATSFAAFMMAYTGRSYQSGLTLDGFESPEEISERMEDRFDVFYRFLGQMGARNKSSWPV